MTKSSDSNSKDLEIAFLRAQRNQCAAETLENQLSREMLRVELNEAKAKIFKLEKSKALPKKH